MKTFESQWRACFERFARTYEDEASISGWSETGLQGRLRLFRALLESLRPPNPARILDLGCGAGTYVRLLAGLGHRAVGLDYSLPSLGRCVAADPGGKGSYVAGEAYALPFEGEAFDLVVSIGVLQALWQPERALDEMVRVLRPAGFLMVEALNGRAPVALARRASRAIRRIPPRVRAYDPRQVREWLAERDLHLVRQAGICLPPRNVPGLARLLDARLLASAMRAWPRLAEVMAHTFLFAAEKPGPQPGGGP